MNGERHGTWTLIWEDGTRSIGPYVSGERHGNWRISFGDGSQGEGPYVDGEMHGKWTIFHEGRGDNVVREVGSYVKDERHGIWTGYDASGNVVGTIRFENGRQVGGSGGALGADATATTAPLQLASPAARSPSGRAMTPRYQRVEADAAWRKEA